MSYDIRFGVKVEGMDGYIAVIDEPEYSSPTYNLRDMFVACMDWNYSQGVWYNCADAIPKFERGLKELREHSEKYEKYNPSNGWGNIEAAIKALDSVISTAKDIVDGGWTWNEIPLEHLWVCW